VELLSGQPDIDEVVNGEERVGFLPRWYWEEVAAHQQTPVKQTTATAATLTDWQLWQLSTWHVQHRVWWFSIELRICMLCPAGTNLDSALRSSSSHLIMILICHTGSVLEGNKIGMRENRFKKEMVGQWMRLLDKITVQEMTQEKKNWYKK
jgi:hypothetical protein